MTSKSVVICGPPAVGKTTVALAIAERFGLRHVSGGDVLKEIARDAGAAGGGDDWWDTREGLGFLERRMSDPSFDREVDRRLLEIFSAGGAVLTSYTLPWLAEDGVKIWLAGSHRSSAERMTARDNIGGRRALEVTRQRYDANVRIYKRIYGIDFGGDLSVFDRIINTDGRGADEVIRLAADAVGELL